MVMPMALGWQITTQRCKDKIVNTAAYPNAGTDNLEMVKILFWTEMITGYPGCFEDGDTKADKKAWKNRPYQNHLMEVQDIYGRSLLGSGSQSDGKRNGELLLPMPFDEKGTPF